MIGIDELWHSPAPEAWDRALGRYWQFVQPVNLALERALDELNLSRVRGMGATDWYTFLLTEYFRWKYTAPNRYATTSRSLKSYAESGALDELHRIKERLLTFDRTDIREGLSIARQIRGLGVAGASGLLALLYPESFGTMDQFVVKALRGVATLPEAAAVARMRPEQLTVNDGVVLIGVMRRKAAENNRQFATTAWTPRKIDQVLWTYGR